MSVAMKSVRTDRFGHNQYLTRKSIFDSQIFDGSATSPFRGILRLVLLASFFYALNNFFVPHITSLISLHRTDTSTRATSRLTGYSLELCLLRFLSASSIGWCAICGRIGNLKSVSPYQGFDQPLISPQWLWVNESDPMGWVRTRAILFLHSVSASLL